MAATLFKHHGVVILSGFVSSPFLDRCRQLIKSIDDNAWTWGSEQHHKWREFGRPRLLKLANGINVDRVEQIISGPISRQFHWFNIFERKQFVEGHKDAGGDVHLLIPIEVPQRQDGGQFWVDSLANVMPVGVGDALLLRASRLLHGTTPVSQDRFGSRRITFNVRIWHSS